ncbi:MAG: hypothetical protein VYE18_00425 [Pseudomonadota bacterium]|nr:hypothetical protein [Pseudomonadota bacterium]
MAIVANGATVYFYLDGIEGAPWIVFSKSLATPRNMWDLQLEAIARD